MLVSLFHCPKTLMTLTNKLKLEQIIHLGLNHFLSPSEFSKSTDTCKCTEVAKNPIVNVICTGFVQIWRAT